MMAKYEPGYLILSTGKRIRVAYAGLCPRGNKLVYGHDGDCEEEETLSKQERREMADFFADQWMAWALGANAGSHPYEYP